MKLYYLVTASLMIISFSSEFDPLKLPYNDCTYQQDANTSLLTCNQITISNESDLVLIDDLCLCQDNVSSQLTVDISLKNIPKLYKYSFQSIAASCCPIQALYLTSNRIFEIEPGTFDGLSNSLTELHLDDNSLEKITADTFGELNVLKILWLQLNRISLIENGAFARMPSLDRLVLHLNQIDFIRDGMFQGLGKLTYITLNSNNIRSIEPGSFKSLENLLTLHLWQNNLNLLPSSKFLIFNQKRFVICL